LSKTFIRMINQYFLEFMGVIVVLYAKLLTDANPLIMAVVYFSVFSIGEGITTGYFTPLAPSASFLLGRLSSKELVYNILAQILGMLCVVITFLPVTTFMEHI
jgi:hypothetical protein